jgi:hypothetical protein
MTLTAILATIYGVAAATKVASQRGIAEYLRPLAPEGAPTLARLGIGAELGLALTLGAATADSSFRLVGGWLSAVFLSTATAIYAMLLTRRGEAQCHCFGDLGRAERRDASWSPALLAFRNAALMALSFTVAGAGQPLVMIATAATLLAVVVGLSLSIRRERKSIAAAVHPLATWYGPKTRMLQPHTWWVNGHPRPF